MDEVNDAAQRDVDVVLTTRELAKLLRTYRINVAQLPEEEFDKIGEEAETLAGLLLELKGDFPKEKEYIQHGSCRFLVLKLDKHRIASIKVRILQRQEPTPERNNDDTNS